MVKDAASVGFYEDGTGKKYPRVRSWRKTQQRLTQTRDEGPWSDCQFKTRDARSIAVVLAPELSKVLNKPLVVESAELRLRPVLITAAVAALGLIPMLFATGLGSEIQKRSRPS